MNILFSVMSFAQNNEKNELRPAHYEQLIQDDAGDAVITNESGLRYVMQSLNNQGELLDHYLCLCTPQAETEAPTFRSPQNPPIVYPLSHLDIFLNRIQELWAKEYYVQYSGMDSSSFVATVPYMDNKPHAAVIEAVKKIAEFKAQLAEGESIRLYLDLSGGLRIANMVIMIVSRLLEYFPEITIKEVICSELPNNDRTKGIIQLHTSTYKLLDLVAGINEFANYGTTKTLKTYIDENKEDSSPSVNRLVAAMTDFSHKIQLCHYGEFKDSIRNLNQAIQQFKAQAGEQTGLAQQLLELLLAPLEDKYQLLFQGDMQLVDYDLRLIRWCFNNNYLQQAMTLITERCPIIFFEASTPLLKIVAEKETAIETLYQEYLQKLKNDVPAQKSFWLLVKNKIDNTNEPDYKRMDELLKSIILQSLQQKKDKGINEAVIASLKKACDKTFIYMPPQEFTDQLLEKIHEIRSYNRTHPQEKRFELDQEIPFPKNYDKVGNYYNAKALIEQGYVTWLQSGLEEAQVKELLLLFYELQAERNDTNHANDKQNKISFEELSNKIDKLLSGLEGILQKE